MYNFINQYKGRRDLIDNYGDNSLLLYALQLKYSIEDIVSVAAESLTDGSDDKKCDLIFGAFQPLRHAYVETGANKCSMWFLLSHVLSGRQRPGGDCPQTQAILSDKRKVKALFMGVQQ